MKTRKIILDLCGGTGAWSKPYKEAGYDVRNITLPDCDVRAYQPPENVCGILAAPPCTMFSYARSRAKTPRDLDQGMEIVISCLKIVWTCIEGAYKKGNVGSFKFWALENPYHGFLKKFLGKPAFLFDPWEFGDGYQKKTALWGYFTEPIKTPVPMTEEVKSALKGNRVMNTIKFDYLKSKDIHPEVFGKFDRQTRRSITSQGFAKAFYKANQ